MAEKFEYENEKEFVDEKAVGGDALELSEDSEIENSKIEAVRLVVPVTDDPSLISVTFRFWVLSFFFSVIGSVINQYYFFRSTSGTFSIYFVNLASYALGKGMAKVLPTGSFTIGGYSMSLNPGPFNIKEHALLGIAVSTASGSAYAIDILTASDLYLDYRMNAFGAIVLLITTQCLGYGMAGVLRKYLIYPADMVWWGNLVQVVFYNAMHNTDEFKTKVMIRGWSYMKFFWVICAGMFVWEFIPQWVAPLLVYFDWVCWINPFDANVWAAFSSISGGGVLSLSFDWTAIGGYAMYYPLYSQLCTIGGIVLSYWIIMPIMWVNNTLGTKTYGTPLTSHLYYENGTAFNVVDFLNDDYSLNDAQYDAGPPAVMTPMYALCFFFSFVSLAACVSHIVVFNGKEIWTTWKSSVSDENEDIHTKMMRVYPEMPQLWYAIFYVVMMALAIMVCEVYDLGLPWWGLLVALAIAWVLTFPICAMAAITGYSPGLNVITELVCGYILPGKPIANMTFKCYGYMQMYQCMLLLSDLKLGHYMKIPPRSLFVAQTWGTIVGAVFNYFTMILIIDARRSYLDGSVEDPNGLWTGYQASIFWGSALIYGALGPARMFDPNGNYGFVYYGFLVGILLPIVFWGLSKKFPKIQWDKFNISIIANGMSGYPSGYVVGILPTFIVCVLFQFYLFRWHKNWWQKYTFILSAALDTGAAFTGLVIFFFLGGGVSPKLAVNVPSWWGNYYTEDGDNAPYLSVDRCGAAHRQWKSGGL